MTWLLVAMLVLTACGQPARQGIELADLAVNDAPPSARMRAGYATVINHDARPRKLTGVTSPAFRAIEFHRSETRDGVTRMREETDLEVPAHGELVFAPFARHLMLMGATGELQAGDRVALRFCFADGECVDAEAPVRRVEH